MKRMVITVEQEIAYNRRRIVGAQERIAAIRADAERRVSWEEGHIGYLESEIARLEANRKAVAGSDE